MDGSNWMVGKVAQRCGVKVSTLHFYEQKGLIHSTRYARCSNWSLHRLPEHGHLLLECQVLKDQLTPRFEV